MDDKTRLSLIAEILRAPNVKALQLLLLDQPITPGGPPVVPPVVVPPAPPPPSGNVTQNLLYGAAGSLISLMLGGAGVIGLPIGPDGTTAGWFATILPMITGLFGLNAPVVDAVVGVFKPKA